MKRCLLILALAGLAACTQELAPPPAAPEPAPYTAPAIAPAPVDENGLSPLDPPPSTAEAPRESTPLELAIEEDKLADFKAALAGREPTENLLMDALTCNSERIVSWLCDTKGLRLTKLDKIPYAAVRGPDSPDYPCPELDAEALSGLRLLFKACPTVAGDDALMATCINHYCLYQHPRSLRYLLARGANPNGRDAEGRTPLDYAHYHEWKKGIAILRSKGATAHTKGRSFQQKEKLFYKHDCPKRAAYTPGSPVPVVIDAPYYVDRDPGPDGPNGGIICTKCGATE